MANPNENVKYESQLAAVACGCGMLMNPRGGQDLKELEASVGRIALAGSDPRREHQQRVLQQSRVAAQGISQQAGRPLEAASLELWECALCGRILQASTFTVPVDAQAGPSGPGGAV